MRFLRPKAFSLAGFRFNSCDGEEFAKLDIRKLYRCFRDGEYCTESNKYYLLQRTYSGKLIYDMIPRACRYGFPESMFSKKLFNFINFYPWDYEENQVLFDWAEYLLENYPNHRKTQRIMKNLEKTNPELFI